MELATFHAAKGLEWPVVFLAGLEQGLMPIGHAETPEAQAEERRLLYVAVTRAPTRSCMLVGRRRTSARGRSPARRRRGWTAIEAAVQRPGRGGPATGWRTYLADGRAELEAADGGRRRPRPPGLAGSNADPDVLDALRTWRSRTARATGVPAYVLFHDTTLAAMAEACPATATPCWPSRASGR